MTDALDPTPREVPDKPTIDGLEATWMARWDDEGTYRFDREPARARRLLDRHAAAHGVGHRCTSATSSATPTPTSIARFWRMSGKDVFYPMGWDDNGLATERRVENYYGVRCDPSLPYDPAFEPPDTPGEKKISDLAQELRRALPPPHGRRRGDLQEPLAPPRRQHRLEPRVLDDLAPRPGHLPARLPRDARARRGLLRPRRPTLWDVDFRTAVSQAELEDRERPGSFHRVAFARADGAGSIEIETTRPEMLASCVALVAHPDDERYAALFGTTVVTPLFGVEVPIVAHELADPEKGSGIAMICTFGDTTDVTWWRELSLPTRALIGRDGRFLPAGLR